jgi:hypothetical protein
VSCYEIVLILKLKITGVQETAGYSVKQRLLGSLTFAVSQRDPQRGLSSSITRCGARADVRGTWGLNASGLCHAVPSSEFKGSQHDAQSEEFLSSDVVPQSQRQSVTG